MTAKKIMQILYYNKCTIRYYKTLWSARKGPCEDLNIKYSIPQYTFQYMVIWFLSIPIYGNTIPTLFKIRPERTSWGIGRSVTLPYTRTRSLGSLGRMNHKKYSSFIVAIVARITLDSQLYAPYRGHPYMSKRSTPVELMLRNQQRLILEVTEIHTRTGG